MAILLDSAARLLFAGDSITDCDWKQDPERIGFGYVRLVRDMLRAAAPHTAPHVLNAGVGGNTILDLAARWKQDVLDAAPDAVSIMIGVNDVWCALDKRGGGVPLERYVSTYRTLLGSLRDLRPDCQIVLCEPTIILPPAGAGGPEALRPYCNAVHQLGEQFRVKSVVPTNKAMLHCHRVRPDIAWTTDGVHPTSSGHMVLAKCWLETTAAIGRG